MSNAIETFEIGDLTVSIFPDYDGESPREWDNLGKMVFKNDRYNPMGDESTPDLASLLYDLLYQSNWCNREYVMLDGERVHVDYFGDMLQYDERGAVDKAIKMLDGLYLVRSIRSYSHGYTAVRDMGDYWDDEADGWIFVSRADVLKEYSAKIMTPKVKTSALACLKGEIETYDQYITGDVYGYVIEDADGEHVDSCWGFYGLDDCTKEAQSTAEWHAKDRAAKDAEDKARDAEIEAGRDLLHAAALMF